MRFVVAAIILSLGSPAVAGDLNWHSKAGQTKIVGALDNLARWCTKDFGFTRLPEQPDDMLSGKLEAYLLLASNPDHIVDRWANMLGEYLQIKVAPKDHALVDRVADALKAAEKDSISYQRAEALYVETAIQPVRRSLSACQQAAGDEFIAKNLMNGHGSLERFEAILRAAFARSVALPKEEQSKRKK
jgi:hypothetical protein